jgi:hypothetical protein
MSHESDGVSMIEQLIALQRRQNEWFTQASPEERAAAAKAALRRMPGQVYLFDEEPDE